ncbi:hypothetical protein FA13DRAFT_1747313 [Coprinellus micaceus]|uniref:Uncharacterized protein n=1 Tax=Coprinellus micaceus TaxID=71717 RepID=A0A4Y7S3R5_COPMI|nr:hypothetical protein FA13DRAFT_1747313 [Coprinellus micaceus]
MRTGDEDEDGGDGNRKTAPRLRGSTTASSSSTPNSTARPDDLRLNFNLNFNLVDDFHLRVGPDLHHLGFTSISASVSARGRWMLERATRANGLHERMGYTSERVSRMDPTEGLTSRFGQVGAAPVRATILQTFPLIRGSVSLQDSLSLEARPIRERFANHGSSERRPS